MEKRVHGCILVRLYCEIDPYRFDSQCQREISRQRDTLLGEAFSYHGQAESALLLEFYPSSLIRDVLAEEKIGADPESHPRPQLSGRETPWISTMPSKMPGVLQIRC